MTDWVVRLATVNDVDSVVDLRVAFLKDVGRVDDETSLREAVASYLGRAIPAGDCVVWIAEAEMTVVATAAMTVYERMSWDGVSREGYVLSMYTTPEHRRRGIATALVSTIQDYARAEGLKLCLIAMDEAHGIYERAGFAPDPRYLRWR